VPAVLDSCSFSTCLWSLRQLLQPSTAAGAFDSCCSSRQLLQRPTAAAAPDSGCSSRQLLQLPTAAAAPDSCCSPRQLQPPPLELMPARIVPLSICSLRQADYPDWVGCIYIYMFIHIYRYSIPLAYCLKLPALSLERSMIFDNDLSAIVFHSLIGLCLQDRTVCINNNRVGADIKDSPVYIFSKLIVEKR
jgi:hypothetical protein